jgi:quinate dehydrogenase (quinone)
MATGNVPRGFPRILQWLLAGLMLIIGLAIGILGVKLATLGGTLYFAIMGLVMVIAAVLIFRNRRAGIALYAIAFIASIVWAIGDAGWTYWPLFSRLFAFGALALLSALVWPYLSAQPTKKGPAFGLAAVLAVVLAASFGWMFKSQPLVSATQAVPVKPVAPGEQQKNWEHWGNTTHGDRLPPSTRLTNRTLTSCRLPGSPIPAISRKATVPARKTRTPRCKSAIRCMSVRRTAKCWRWMSIAEKKWRYDAKATAPNWQRCRGLGYYEDSQAQAAAAGDVQPAACARRLFLPTTDARLIAIDADTGKTCEAFGDRGIVDLSVGMGEIKPGYYQQTSTPLVAGNVVVVGGRVADNFSTGEPPGVVRAYDVHTGKLAWAWDPGNPALTGLPPEGRPIPAGRQTSGRQCPMTRS